MLHDTLASARLQIAIYLTAREQFEPAEFKSELFSSHVVKLLKYSLSTTQT